MFYNASADEIRIRHKERIAQGELVKTLDYSFEETIIQPEQTTSRVGGFGSTGVTK
jgi:dUTPase